MFMAIQKLPDRNPRFSHRRIRVTRARERLGRQIEASRFRPQSAIGPNSVWVSDFIFWVCADGQQLECFTLIDGFTREVWRLVLPQIFVQPV